jgi:hypothetical protein
MLMMDRSKWRELLILGGLLIISVILLINGVAGNIWSMYGFIGYMTTLSVVLVVIPMIRISRKSGDPMMARLVWLAIAVIFLSLIVAVLSLSS